MASARVIHFGRDDCNRVQALRHVGYEVSVSDSLGRLRRDLERNEDVDAMIVSGAGTRCAEQAAVLVRKHVGAPLILFRRADVALDVRRFDRVFSWFTPEAHWLFDTAVLVMQCKELRAESERLRHESELCWRTAST